MRALTLMLLLVAAALGAQEVYDEYPLTVAWDPVMQDLTGAPIEITSYEVLVSDYPARTAELVVATVTNTSQEIPTPPSVCGQYVVGVRAVTDSGRRSAISWSDGPRAPSPFVLARNCDPAQPVNLRIEP